MRVYLLRCTVAAAVACTGFLVAAARTEATPTPQLLAQYQPAMQFDPLESFRPTSVQSFIADSDLEQLVAPPNTWAVVDTDPEPGELPGPGTGIWRLNQDSCTPAAAIGGLACYASAWEEGSGVPVVYGRVTEDDGKIVLQYWYFYYANTYSYLYPPSDFIWQAHEGDWELVNVVLSEDEEPLSAGYSQHCRGQQRTWQATPKIDDTHPIVHVAIGSHANYFTAGVHPIQVACIPPQAIAILQALRLPLPVDYAFTGPTDERPVMPIRKIDDEHPNWVSFPGFWGELQYFHAPAPIGSVPFATSPVGPAYHVDWDDPLGAMADWPAG
jgi:hypothetical protein